MKNMRKLLAVALLVLTLGLPTYADGQMDTDKPSGGVIIPPPPQTAVVQEIESDSEQTPGDQMDTTLAAVLGMIESILALI